MEADNRAPRFRLFGILHRRFNLSELRTLCFLLEVDYDGLGGENKADKARELIAYLERRGRLDALIEAGRELREDIRWPEAGPASPAPAGPSAGTGAAGGPGPVERAEDLAGCVFISYDRGDQGYARRLGDELRDRGLKPWMDDRIDFGDRWWQTIVRAVQASAAFVVVMTPEAERSRWVEREVFLAEREGKPIVPLLLRGRPFSLLINVQYVDVTGERMLPPVFYDRLGRALGRPVAPEPMAQEERKLPGALAPRQPDEPEMVLIPAGAFRMGSDPAKDKDAYGDEQPQHVLTLPDYYLARTPVTNAQYLAFVREAGQDAPEGWEGGKPLRGKENHPVVYVSWRDALAYCRWLARATGRPYAVPSEAEWEKGARGVPPPPPSPVMPTEADEDVGGRTTGEGEEGARIYPWGDEWDAARCNSRERGKGGTTPVGAYPQGASPYGLLDMAGNVWEWTRSLYKDYPYDPADGREDLEVAGTRVVRGGAFNNSSRYVRCAFRSANIPDYWNRYCGFRVVLGPGFPR